MDFCPWSEELARSDRADEIVEGIDSGFEAIAISLRVHKEPLYQEIVGNDKPKRQWASLPNPYKEIEAL